MQAFYCKSCVMSAMTSLFVEKKLIFFLKFIMNQNYFLGYNKK